MGLAPQTQACQACGNKAGVPFERIHPGQVAQIILFVRPHSGLSSFNKRADLTFQLQRSGHTVHVIDNVKSIEAAIRANRTEVVVAELEDATALRSRLAGDASAPLVLTLTDACPAASDADQKLSSCQLRAAADQGKDVVQTIERFIYTRQAGEIIGCPAYVE